MEINRHGLNREELNRIRICLMEGSRYRIYDNNPLEIAKGENRALNRDTLSNMRYNGEINVLHAYVLNAVYALGHATPNMVYNLLEYWRKNTERKAIPEMGVEYSKKLLSNLGRKGLVLSQQYQANRHNVHIYTITSYGFNLMRAILGMDTMPYDMTAMYRCDKEIYKILGVNAITVEMGNVLNCTRVLVNGRFGGVGDAFPEVKEYVYGIVESDDVLYLLEPAYFIPDKRLETEQESLEKVGKRLRLKIPLIYDRLVEKYNKKVQIIFVVENSDGSGKLVKLLHGMDDPKGIFQSALITCENLFYAARGNLNHTFMRWYYTEETESDKAKPKLMPVGPHWRTEA